MCVCVYTLTPVGNVFFAEGGHGEVRPGSPGELDLSGIDDDEIDKVSSGYVVRCTSSRTPLIVTLV